jgi:hypothetical protein
MLPLRFLGKAARRALGKRGADAIQSIVVEGMMKGERGCPAGQVVCGSSQPGDPPVCCPAGEDPGFEITESYQSQRAKRREATMKAAGNELRQRGRR